MLQSIVLDNFFGKMYIHWVTKKDIYVTRLRLLKIEAVVSKYLMNNFYGCLWISVYSNEEDREWENMAAC